MRFAPLALAVLLPQAALAGGYTLPARGVRSISLGGANVAGAEGLDAFWMNPANLGDTQLGVEVGLVSLSATYTPPADVGEGPSSSDAPPLPIPALGFIYRVNDTFSVGLAAYSPWAGTLRFSETGSQRYQLIKSNESLALTLELAGAVRLGPVRFGLGLTNAIVRVKQRLMLSAYTGLFGGPRDPDLDVLAEIDLEAPLNIGGNAGLSVDLGPLTFGAMVQLPFTASGDATFKQRKPSSVFFDPVEIRGDKARLSLPFPIIARAGLAYKITRWLKAEAAFSFEDWSTQQRLTIEPLNFSLVGVPAIGTYAVGPAVIEKRMQDTYAFHLGASAEVNPRVTVRAGGFWESSAFTDATFSMALPDDQKLGLALGASVRLGEFRLDAAFSRIFQGTRVVTTSELRQSNPTNPAQAAIIGNGTYDTSYWVGGLAFAWTPGPSAAKNVADPRPTLDTSVDEELAR